MEEITIIGAGIAGLTTAIALNEIGKKAVIFEAAQQVEAIGAGLGMGANAIMAFDRIGIKDVVIRHGRVLESFTVYDQKGKVITKADNNALTAKYGTNNFTIHRAELYKVLLSKLKKGQIVTGKQAVRFKQNPDSVTILFEDGSKFETRYLIAADGIHSHIRKTLIPDSKPRYSGYSCWRAVIENTNLSISESSETWGKNGRFGIVPLADKKLYWFACINGPENSDKFKNFSISSLKNHFRDFHAPIPQILLHTKDEHLLWNDICDIRPLNQFVFNNIVLIGDAAHATTPNLGQGACQAIEDAVILADEISKNSNLNLAFQMFEKRRLKRTRFIIETSQRIGKIAQTDNPLLIWLRNKLFRMLPKSINEKQLEKLYTVDF